MGQHLLLVDAHVHVYECFDPGRFLESAYRNFRSEAERREPGAEFTGMLCLTEKAEHRWFLDRQEEADGRGTGDRTAGWRFVHTDEACSLAAQGPAGESLILVAGRQIVSAENVELLAIGTLAQFEDGLPAADVLPAVRTGGGIPVVPWGFGKWSGRRGALLDRWLDSESAERFFLGDNSGRPWFFPRPAHFKRAEARGIRILPGSDPLPFPPQERKPGSFGFAIREAADPRQPAACLGRLLADRTTELLSYGKLERANNFVRNQLAMQLNKRKSGSGPPQGGPAHPTG